MPYLAVVCIGVFGLYDHSFPVYDDKKTGGGVVNETKQMAKEIRVITLGLTAVLALVGWVIFPGNENHIALGIIIGSLTGLLGFQMILRMSESILEDNGENGAYASYLNRYLFYMLVFALSIWRGIHVIALVVGMLVHKASILIYTWRHRKEDD